MKNRIVILLLAILVINAGRVLEAYGQTETIGFKYSEDIDDERDVVVTPNEVSTILIGDPNPPSGSARAIRAGLVMIGLGLMYIAFY